MTPITIKKITSKKEILKATFLPENGMNLISLKKNSIEVIDQETWPLFDERFAGLGALIGPHFHHRKAQTIPAIKDESLFPHIQKIKSQGLTEPFSHGIARYAPWSYKTTDTIIDASIKGTDLWRGIALKDLEGFDFEMSLKAEMLPTGLIMDLSVKAQHPSIVGLHYYYSLPFRTGVVKGNFQEQYRSKEGLKQIPNEWIDSKTGQLNLKLNQDIDFGFFPKDNYKGKLTLETATHNLHIEYFANTLENSFQIYHPSKSSYVCLEPLTAKNPRDLKINESSMTVQITIDSEN